MGIKLCNRLPVGIKSIESSKDFKNKLRLYSAEHLLFGIKLFAYVDTKCRKSKHKINAWVE